jgi:thioredoxin 1
MAAANVVEVTASNFDEVVGRSAVPVLLDFWAEWCGPCKMLAPMIDELAVALAGKCVVGKVNVDQAGDLAQRFSVQAIPTLILFKGGKVSDVMVGVASKKDILAKIAALG